jgi:hypothetical protein
MQLPTAPDEFGPGWLIPSSAGGKCKLDGMPIECSELANKMELGFVATEYLLTRSQIQSIVGSYGSSLAPQGAIVGFGLGIFVGGYLKPDNEGLHWGEQMFTFQGASAQSSNPNCFVNAVPGSPGIARGYTFGHDGYHGRGPGRVIALPAMVGGKVTKVTSGDNSGASFNSIVDIALKGGKYVVLLKDLGNVKVVKNQIIGARQQIGNVTGGMADGFDMLKGLHFALIRSEYYKEYRDLTPHTVDPSDPEYRRARDTIDANQAKWFVDPLKEGPFKCPGINTRLDYPIKNGQPTSYPILR